MTVPDILGNEPPPTESGWVTRYGAQRGRFFVVALVFLVSGTWMLRSDSALAEDEAFPSPEPPGGTLIDQTASAAGQNPYEWDHESSEMHGPVQPLNIAHRGGAKIGPENTLTGFWKGRSVGADVLELDVHLTENEKLVVIHNERVDDTTNGTGLVREMTLQQLKRLDAGYDFTYEHGETHPYRGKGVVIPTLEEVYQEFPDVPLNIEIKEDQKGIEQKLWEVIEEAEAEDHTLVVAKKTSVIRRFREVSGKQVKTGASAPEMLAFIICSHLYPSCQLQPSYRALQVWKEVGTLRIVQAAHRSGIQVDVWTVDDEEDMHRFIDYGVDGIMTDRPDRLNRLLERHVKDRRWESS